MKKPPDEYYVDEGSNAVLQWTYCKPPNSLVTGIIVSRGDIKISIDVARNTTKYPRNNQRYSITWPKKGGSITFTVRNVSMHDRGRYVLEIRMVGYRDLPGYVNVVVRKAGLQPISFIFQVFMSSIYSLISNKVFTCSGVARSSP